MSAKEIPTKLVELAMPQLTHLSKVEVEQAKKDITKLHNQKKLQFVEKYNSADLFFEGDDLNQSWSLFHNNAIVYFVLVKKVQLFNGDAVRQTLVDRTSEDELSQGIAQYVIFNKLIPKYHSIASDCQQSDHGRRMWVNLIGTVLSSKPLLKINLLNTNDKTELEIDSIPKLAKHHVWGESSYYQRFILVISDSRK